MKKRILALLMCVLMVGGTIPLSPYAEYFRFDAVAYNIETLEEAISNVPPQQEWDNFISTDTLAAYYDIAVLVMKNPENFSQSDIDDYAAKLQAAIDALEYHTLGVSLNKTSHSGAIGESFVLRATLAPDGKGADPVVWTSSDEDCVSVNEGTVTIKKYSLEPVEITAASNGYSASCLVTTLNPLGGVSLSHSQIEIFEGDSFKVVAEAYGVDQSALPTDEVIYSWASNNNSVATVAADGTVTGIKQGECTVTVTAASGNNIYTGTCTVTVKETIPVTSLSSAEISSSGTINLTVNEEYEFSVLVLPTNASNKNLSWSCDDSSVLRIGDAQTSATGVASATLTALKEGTTVVTYVTTDGTNISGSFTVVVKPLITSLAFTEERKVITPETSGERFTTVIMPSNAGNQTLEWKSSDTTVCEVDYNGVLYPKSIGTCTVTATTKDGSEITVSGTVRVARMASLVSVNKSTLKLETNDTYQLTATVITIDNTAYGEVQWSSGNPEIATVDSNGVVTAKYPGTVVIKATALDGTEKYATCIVTVTQPLEGLTLPATKGVYVGNTITVEPTFIPSYASDKTVSWSSSDTDVATVDANGVVTGKKVGKTTITCTSQDGGFVATCVVTVLIATTGVSLNYTSSRIWKGSTVTLIPTITPEDATNKNVSWTSSDNAVATVDVNGVVTGVAGGTCTITCTTANSAKTATCEITVLESVTGVSFASDELSMYLGQTYENKASVIPSTATNQNLSWATSNDLVVRVSQTGTFTAVGEGTAVITVKTEDGGYIATCTVTVYSKVPVTGITLDVSTLTLDVGEYYTFLATVYPDNASDKGVTWRTDNSSVVAISQTGLIKAKSAGTAIITATTDDGNYSKQCKVIVTQPVTGIRLNISSVTMAKGNQKSLIANVLPTNASNREVIWESSDEEVAVVSATGVVTAVGAGNCSVTATTEDGYFTATCDFTVYIPVTGITIGATEMNIPKGETRLLSVTVSPSDASNRTVSWHSSNTSVASVNEVGQVTARNRGTAIIYATTNDGAFIAECVVQVVQLATSVTLNYASITLDVGAYKQFTATLTPATVSDTTVKWSTSNKEVVVISKNGLIKGVGPGTATITCRSGDGAVSTTCRITVTQPVTGIELNPTAMAVREGGMRSIVATVVPANATDSRLTWISSDPTIANVDSDGIVYGNKPGKVTITAISSDNSEVTATCTVKVIRSVTGMSLNKASVTMNVGSYTTVTPVFTPVDATVQTAKWTSSNYDVADVDSNGKITGKAPGYAVITATSTDRGFTATCSVLVIQPVSGVKLSESSVSLEVDEQYEPEVTVLPSDASDKSVTWYSSDKTVASVSSAGVITGKNQGSATITCKTVDGSYKATIKITVLKKVTGISLNYSSKVLYLDKTLQLKATVTPTDATNKDVYWYTFDKNVATVNQNGLVTPVSPGSVTIGVRTADGSYKAYCKIEVKKPVEEISLNKTSHTIYVDEYYKLKATVLPDDATDKTVTWSVSDSTVLALSSTGLIKGKSAGVATVTATTENGLSASCRVTVLQSVEGVELSYEELTLYTGEKETLTATVLPYGAYNQGVKWSSSNTAVAKVTNGGEITAIKSGTAVITVTTSEGGYTATCHLTVKQHVTAIGFNTTSLEIRKGNEADLTVSVLPADASDKGYTIVSSDPQKVFVDQNGHIVALKGGTATITVTSDDNGKTGVCSVTVIEPVSGVSLEKYEDTVLAGDKLTIEATVFPEDANNKNVIWSSSDESVATVSDDGVITVLGEGQVTVTVTTVDNGFMDSCVLTCLQPPVTIETENEIGVLTGESGKINVNVLPENSYDKTVLFSSSDESIVEVDSEGNFIALSPGVANITIRAQLGSAYTVCTITVTEPVSAVEIEEKEITLYKNEQYGFSAEVYPHNASDKRVTWKVSNSQVAKISNDGALIALAKGKTYVTVTTVDGRYIDYCLVNVVLAVEEIQTPYEQIEIVEGESQLLEFSVIPEDAYNKEVIFESDNEDIVRVASDGTLTAVEKGEAVVRIISVDNPHIMKEICVNVIRLVEDIELSFSEEYLWVGESGKITATLSPSEPTDKTVKYISSDETIATVDENGTVTALKAGEVTITVASADGNAKTDITIEIRQQVTGIEISESEKTVNVGEQFSLTATILPEDAYNKDVVWTCDDEEIACVTDGTVTANKTGTATITVSSAENGEIKAECVVTVIRKAESVKASFSEEYLWVGESGEISVEVLPEDTTDKSVVYESSDETIATVDENGTVAALKAGEATITVKTVDEGAIDFVTIEIRQQVTGIEISESDKTVNVGEQFSLTATILPEDAYNKDVVWTCDDEEIACVTDGTVTANKTGTATITVSSAENGEIKAECVVTVIRKAESVKASFSEEYLWVGESGEISVEVLPEDTTDKSVVYESSDETIATVDENGTVTALKAGEATITVKTVYEGAIDFVTIEIRQQVTGIEISESDKTVNVGEQFSLTATILPEDAYNKDVVWTCDDEEIACVTDGTVTANKTGTATITVSSAENGEVKAECVVTVIRKAESVKASFSEEYLWVGESGEISVEVLPEDTTDKSVIYESSDETIATVDENGTVTALKAGEATITVKTVDEGAIDFVTIEIRQQVTGIEISESEKTVNVGEQFSLTATILPEDAYNKDVVWTCDDEEIACVTDGTVTANKTGTATITVSSAENGEIKAECVVTVIKQISSVAFSEQELTIEKGNSYQLQVVILPEDTTQRELNFESSDDEVVSVDENGNITALKAGNAVITVNTQVEGVFAQCEVTVKVTSNQIVLDKEQAEMYCSDVLELTAQLLPADTTDTTLVWESSDESVAVVTDGKVTALDKGVATITVKADDSGVSAQCEITVLRHVESVKMSVNSVDSFVAREFILTAEVSPADADDKSLIWKSSDTSVVTVNDGIVTPVSKGTAVISVRSIDGGYTDYCFVTVGIGIDSLTLSESQLSLHKGESHSLTVKILPEDATVNDVVWTSSDNEIATVKNGVVTAGTKSGTVEIRATAADNSEAFAVCSVLVIESVTGVDLNETEIQLMSGDVFTLVPVITPENATYPSVEWKTSDEAVAVVDSEGNVTAVNPGTAYITCTNTDSQLSAVCSVFVPKPVESFTLEADSVILIKNESLEININANPSDHDESFTFVTNDSTVLTVDRNSGVALGVSPGVAKITAMSSLTGKTAEIEIEVIQPVESVIFELDEYTGAYTGLTHKLNYTVSPSNAYNKSVTWKSSDESVATVDSQGYITYHSKGEVIITVTSVEAGLYDECKVTVNQSPETIYINQTSKTLAVGESCELTIAILPVDSANQTVIWSSSSPTIADVDENGVVTAYSAGTAIITVTTWNGKTAVCTVTVE